MYILSCISLIGSVDYVFTMWNNLNSSRNPMRDIAPSELRNEIEDYQKVSVLLGSIIICVYFIAYIVDLIMAPFDVQVYMKDFQSTDTWATTALADSSFG